MSGKAGRSGRKPSVEGARVGIVVQLKPREVDAVERLAETASRSALRDLPRTVAARALIRAALASPATLDAALALAIDPTRRTP